MSFFDVITRINHKIVILMVICGIFDISFVHSQRNLEGSYLHIIQPQTLRKRFGAKGVEQKSAMFGIPSYGHGSKLTGILVYPQANNLLGCNSIDKTKISPRWPSNGVLVVVIDRGNCTFVTKVRHAERAGANAVIVVDNRYQRNFPYMADDETGHTLTIPSMFIRRYDGDLIKKAMLNGTVLVAMSWRMPSPDNIVEWELWTSSDDDASDAFKKDFKKVVQVLGASASFVPRYFIRNGQPVGCVNKRLPCQNQCTNTGRYCSLDPDRDFSVGLSGLDVVQENLRQMCLFKHLNKTKQTIKWWDYVTKFEKVCNAKAEKTWNISCSKSIMKSLDINPDPVIDCVTKSGEAKINGGENKLLGYEINLRRQVGVFYLPTITVNGIHYRGSLSCPFPIDITNCGVLKTICAGFKAGTEPLACKSAPGCGVGLERDVCGQCNGTGAFDACRRCLPKSDPRFKVNGKLDACGQCLNPASKLWNRSCIGCDGVKDSTKRLDNCGICLELNDPNWGQACALKKDKSAPPLSVYIIIIICSILCFGGIAAVVIRIRERRMRRDVDLLLKHYLILDPKNQPEPHAAANNDEMDGGLEIRT